MKKLFVCLFILALSATAFAVPPWLDTYQTPLRERYASPTGTGGTTLDYKNSVESVLIGGVTAVTGLLGNALAFDGVNDKLEVPSTGISTDSTFTIAAWIRNSVENTRQDIYAEGKNTTAAGRIAIAINSGASGNVSFQIVNDAGSSATAACTGKSTNDGNWHLIMGRLNGTAMTTLWDGAPCASSTSPGGTFTLTRVCVVASCAGGPSVTYGPLDVDELKIHDSAISDAAALAEYNSGAGVAGTPSDALHAGFHFNEAQAGIITNPYKVTAVDSNTVPGDIVWFRGGTYTLSGAELHMSKSGTASNPIVYRNYPNEHPIIDGVVEIEGADYNWLWGFEITDPDGSIICMPGQTSLLNVANGSDHFHGINNTVHSILESSGLCVTNGVTGRNLTGVWNSIGTIMYGNNISSGTGNPTGHSMYTQSEYALYGTRYVVNNIFHDHTPTNGYHLHAYSTNSFVQGFDIENNIFAQTVLQPGVSRSIIGGKPEDCDFRNVLRGNQYYISNVEVGYRRPGQIQIENNYLGKATFNIDYWWGAGETRCDASCIPGPQPCGTPKALPNTFTGNTILYSSGRQLLLWTAAYLDWNGGAGVSQGQPALQNPGVGTGDVWDNNVWSSPLNIDFQGNNVTTNGISTLAAFRTATLNAGKQYDTNSTTTAMPTADRYWLSPNEYEPKIAHLAAYNWDLSANISVNVSGAFPLCAQCSVYKASDPYGTPVLNFTNFGANVSIPMAGNKEFEAFIIRQTSP